MAYNWVKQHEPTADVSAESVDFDEKYTVYGYTAGPNSVPWYDLLIDRPSIAPGTSHPTVVGAIVKGFTPESMSTRDNLWRVTVNYSNRDDLGTPPHQRPARISMTSETVYVPTITWQNGDPIINTAGGLIFGVEKPVNHWIFHVEKNVLVVPAWVQSYGDAVNSGSVSIAGLTIPAHYLLLRNLVANPAEPETVSGVTYNFLAFSFDLVFNPLDWKTRLFNMGTYQIFNGKRVPCIDANGEKTQEPMFLTATGELEVYPPSVSEAAFIASVKSNMREGWLHELLDFSVLPLT